MENAEKNLFITIENLIEESKQQSQIQVNSVLTILFWKIGHHCNEFILSNKRGEYGKKVISDLSNQLVLKFGRNFEEKNLRRMLQFAEQFKDFSIVVSLSRQLSWSHLLVIFPIKNELEKAYYLKKIADENWGVRELRKNINSKLFHRTEIADSQLILNKNIEKGHFKDPYFIDFLNLDNNYLEKDLENAILNNLEKFILELGKGFSFIERQKRMIIDGEDFYLDLLFFNRKIKRLVAIELKIGKFQAKYKGQMELYLKWLNKYERQEGEQEPIGLILCPESSKEQIELLEMHNDGILVAEYWTELPPKEIFQKQLHQAWIEAKEKIDILKIKENL